MSAQKPLVLSNGQTQQLQAQNDLDIPLVDRVELLEAQIKSLTIFLLGHGFDLPDELTRTL